MNISFYPGPSQLHPQVKDWIIEGYNTGLITVNHRSKPFMKYLQKALEDTKKWLDIPDEYEVFFLSSATEAWEVIAQTFPQHHFTHYFNGAFGEKWSKVSSQLQRKYNRLAFDPVLIPSTEKIESREKQLLCITENETSNGTQLPKNFIQQLRKEFKNALIAIDATSSMAGTTTHWENGDIWYASVQKCFGLPSGLCMVVCSPNAIEQALINDPNLHYNSFTKNINNIRKYQTTHTPNITNIYLLSRLAEFAPTFKHIKDRQSWLYDAIKSFDPLIKNPLVRSSTVLTFEGHSKAIIAIKKQLENKNITLGNGYGKWKETSFRIANFPAIPDSHYEQLLQYI